MPDALPASIIAQRKSISEALATIRRAASSDKVIGGATHTLYRYPARFSPCFARAAIEAFSGPGDLVLDPFMGGGTAIVEALLAGRIAIGNDLNSLAVFLARAKTSPLAKLDELSLRSWLDEVVPRLLFNTAPPRHAPAPCPHRTRNMGIPRARALKKIMHLALSSIPLLPSVRARNFARAILLNSGQWALNGRRHPVTASMFREHLISAGKQMLTAINDFSSLIPRDSATPTLIQGDASRLPLARVFSSGVRADLIVTSPPYPGIHVLYHRWQLDGRKESPAAYWLANCQDGNGSAHYNLADRREAAADSYFHCLTRALCGVRSVVKEGAYLVQLVAFARPSAQLPRFLEVLAASGFQEVRLDQCGLAAAHRRIWRDVPSRSWHANAKGKTAASREVVLVHRAV